MGMNLPKALNTVYANPLPIANSHCAVTTRPKAEMKKKFPTKTLSTVTPRHSIKLSDRVVRVVPNAPSASADCDILSAGCSYLPQKKQLVIEKNPLTPAPRDLGDSTIKGL